MQTWIFVLIGLAAGLVSGFFGLGGGTIIVPALTYFAGFSQHRAVGTSLAVLLLPAGLGAVMEFHRQGNVDLRAAGLMAVALFASAWISGRWANRVAPAPRKLAFGIFLVLVGARIVFSTAGKFR